MSLSQGIWTMRPGEGAKIIHWWKCFSNTNTFQHLLEKTDTEHKVSLICPFNNSNCSSSNFPKGTRVGMLAQIWLIMENFHLIKTHEGLRAASDCRAHFWDWTFVGIICWQLNFTTPFNCKWRGTIPRLDVEEIEKDVSIICRIRNQHFLLLAQLFLSLKTTPQRFLLFATTTNSSLSFPVDSFLWGFLMI